MREDKQHNAPLCTGAESTGESHNQCKGWEWEAGGKGGKGERGMEN